MIENYEDVHRENQQLRDELEKAKASHDGSKAVGFVSLITRYLVVGRGVSASTENLIRKYKRQPIAVHDREIAELVAALTYRFAFVLLLGIFFSALPSILMFYQIRESNKQNQFVLSTLLEDFELDKRERKVDDAEKAVLRMKGRSELEILGQRATGMYWARVLRVIEGDLIEVQGKDESPKIVKLESIETPELGNGETARQPFALEAKKEVERLVLDELVLVYPIRVVESGQVHVYVVLDVGTNVNAELVKQGLAWEYNDIEILRELQSDAKESKLGLWSLPNPQEPWDWRAAN
jgi:endonuclease YncB( thermonuclease family)